MLPQLKALLSLLALDFAFACASFFSLVLQITTQSWKIVAQIAGQGVGGSVLSVGACQLARCNCLMHASLACALFEQPGCNIKNARAAHEQLLPRLLATTVATRVAAEGVGGVGPTVKKPRRVRGLAVCTGRAADTDMRVQATVFMVQPVALTTPPPPPSCYTPFHFGERADRPRKEDETAVPRPPIKHNQA